VLKAGSYEQGAAHVRERIDAFLRDGSCGSLDSVAPISVVTDTLAPEDMPRLYAAADAYVMPTAGEGWGRPFMEALAMGLPTIASNWSGNLAFMDRETSWLIDGELVPVPDDADLFNTSYKGHNWFEADADELAAAALPVVPPRPVSGVAGNRKPDYPAEARRRRLQGSVVLRVNVSAQGAPEEITVLASSGHAVLDQAAVAAVHTWRFEPATRGGVPIAAPADVPVRFRLED
jgi:TonB family protein